MKPITRTLLGLGLATVAAAGVPQPAAAQGPGGFWLSGGLGAGINLNDEIDGNQVGGGSAYIRIGGTTSRRIRLGFEGIRWARGSSSNTVGSGSSSFIAVFSPSSKIGGYLKGGAGRATISRTQRSGNTKTVASTVGLAFTGGVGWEIRVRPKLYLTPSVDYLLQLFGSEQDSVLGPVPETNSLLLLTVGLTLR